MSKKLSIMMELDFGQKVWFKAADCAGKYREGVVTSIVIGPALDVLYDIVWGDGVSSEHYGMELLAEKPRDWVHGDD